MRMRVRSLILSSLILALVFVLGFLSGNFFRGPQLVPALAQNAPSGNGDVNADGEIDLADAVFILTYLFLGGDPPVSIDLLPGQDITALVVRHAEKEPVGENPGLTAEGKLRASFLEEVLSQAHIDAVFATDLRRTQETVHPTAEDHGLEIRIIDSEAPLQQVGALRSLPPGSVALVAGHSFTIPTIMKELGFDEFNMSGFDNLWVVRFGASAEADAFLLNLRYGEEVVP